MVEFLIPHDALIVVGDGEKVLFLRNQGTPFDLKLVTERILEQENPATREQGRDKPGRYTSSAGITPASAFAQTDWHQIGEDRFTAEIAAALYQLAHANRFKDLVIVAPPKVLGNLRKGLHKEVTERIRAEVPKELATHNLQDIQRLLAA